CRVYAFVHLGGPGAAREAAPAPPDPNVADVGALGRMLAQNRDLVVGVTVQPAAAAGVRDARGALERAIAVVEAAQTRGRVMCNIAGMVREPSELLERLRPGDILTHAYSPARLDFVAEGKLSAAALAARSRGVVIDVGHGGEHFDPAIARAAIARGFAPDIISTGAPALQTGALPPPQLTAVMSRFLNLGFGLEQVVAMTTINPARLIGREPKLGTLDLGAPGDVSILELREAPIEFIDAGGVRWMGSRSLRAVQAIRAAAPVAKPAR
ncbi:MAG: amidohydrolase, partial [Betaproteobacteria bacterium]